MNIKLLICFLLASTEQSRINRSSSFPLDILILEAFCSSRMTGIFYRSVSLGKGTVVASKANSLHTVTLDEASSNDEDSSHHNVSVDKPVFRGATLNEMIGSESSKLSRQAEEKAILEILRSLTEEEKREIPDPCMIIRHYRAEKVRTSLLGVILGSWMSVSQQYLDLGCCMDGYMKLKVVHDLLPISFLPMIP